MLAKYSNFKLNNNEKKARSDMKNWYRSMVLLASAVILVAVSVGCSSKEAETDSYSREVAQHIEETGEGSVVTKIIEERKHGLYAIRIQIIKEGDITETVHFLENQNFSISIPVSKHIQIQTTGEAQTVTTTTPDTNIMVFSQKLELARNAMLKTDYITALEAVNESLKIDSYNPQAHMMKGSIFYAMGKYDLAKKEFDYVLKINPGNVEVKRFQKFMESKDDSEKKVKIETAEEQ